jgi:hypothetical protein
MQHDKLKVRRRLYVSVRDNRLRSAGSEEQT